jgi:hypothetical protein
MFHFRKAENRDYVCSRLHRFGFHLQIFPAAKVDRVEKLLLPSRRQK